MNILITGSSGFIGSNITLKLLQSNFNVIGIDNHNDYYDVTLKEYRLSKLTLYTNFTFYKQDIRDDLQYIFEKHNIDIVLHLAAQAGVRYSIINPDAYIESNIVGFMNVLKVSQKYNVKQFIYASSSSVYGNNQSTPFSVNDRVDEPISLYAATKKSNELFTYVYHHLYDLPTIGLRFFTVYGPAGRPDMAYFKFTDDILRDKPIYLYNQGNNKRDYTYINDIVQGIYRIISKWIEAPFKLSGYHIYNLGNNKPQSTLYLIQCIVNSLKKYNKILSDHIPNYVYQEAQLGDVDITYADIKETINDFDWRPTSNLEQGIDEFIKWYIEYYKV